MTFSRSSNIITVSGVETIQSFYGDAANAGGMIRQGHSDRYQYYCDAYTFVISSGAVFTIDNCYLSFGGNGSNNKFNITGTLVIGSEDTVNGLTEALNYAVGVDMKIDSSDYSIVASSKDKANILLNTDAELQVLGATLSLKEGNIRTFNEGTGVNYIFKKARLHNYGSDLGATYAPRLLLTNGTLEVDGLTISSEGGALQFIRGKDLVMANIKDLSLIGIDFFQVNIDKLSPKVIVIEGYTSNGLNYDFAFHQSALGTSGWRGHIKLINSKPGNNISVITKGLATSATLGGEGLLESFISLNAKETDSNGSAIGTVGMYCIDTDNGDRSFYTNNGDYDIDLEYTEFSDVSGNFAEQLLMINVWDRYDDYPFYATNNPLDIRTPFLQRIRKFGYNFISQTLDTDQPLLQSFTLRDNANISQSEAVSSAHTGITITEGTYNLFSKTFSIKVVGDLSVNSFLTAEDIYHYLQYHLAQVSSVLNGRLGGAWHNMMEPSGSDYITKSGKYGGLQVNKGVCIVDENDNLFLGIASLTADDDTVYTAPITPTLTITVKDFSTGLVIQGARVFLETDSGGPVAAGTLIFNELTDVNGQVTITSYGYVSNQPVIGRVRKSTTSPFYKTSNLSGTITSSDFDVTVFLTRET